MRKEHKEILIKELSARLPYGVKATTTSSGWSDAYTVTGYADNRVYLDCPVYSEGDDEWLVESVKPYFRSMSKMTAEERKDWRAKILMSPKVVFSDKMAELYDFCNSHYLDYRKIYDEKDGKWKSMIEMGLALEAPEGMYADKI